MTLREFSDSWLTAHAADVEPTTIETLRYRLAHALEEFGDVPLAALEHQALELAAWRARLPEGLRYPATSALRQALEAAIRWELLTESPAKKAGKNPQPKAREVHPLTVDELELIVGKLDKRDAALASGGGHEGGKCSAAGCSCKEYARSTSSPVPYVLRHTFASNALAAGVGTFELARVMGTSLEMIERTYGHLVQGAEDAFRTRLDAFAASRVGVELASAESGEGR